MAIGAATVDSDGIRSRLDLLAGGTLVFLCLAWGLNHVSIKVANQGLQPVFQSGVRFALGAILVFGWCMFRRIRLFERDGTLLPGIAVGVLFGVEFGFITFGLDYTTASRGVVFVYTMPFVVALGAHFLIPGERMNAIGFFGLALAFCGVIIVFSDKLSLPGPEALFGDFLCLIAAVLWGATTIVIKTTSLRTTKPEKVLLYQLVVAAIVLLPASPLFGPFIRDVTPVVIAAFSFQVLFVVAVTFLIWFWLVRHYPASRLTSFTFLTPVFGVMFGGLLLGEPVSWRLLLALVLVALGIYLVNRPQAIIQPPS
ncbi:DMT family transporter [Microbaculum marinum]|uniref:DMT family transporter n=1 Tax=Microbaculum marinum TaxID=1764581 RepID=A0AAW9RYG2_9HYPH